MTIENIKKYVNEKYGKNLTDQQAAEYAEKYGRLSDDELESVSGGGCDEPNAEQKYCLPCGVLCKYIPDYKINHDMWKCPKCGKIYE